MRLSRARFLLVLPVLIGALTAAYACGKATPVAPAGAVLSISANPSQIGLTGSSTITIFGSKPTGSPLNPGTQIRLSTTIGTIEGIATVQNGGTATATLRGDGRTGAAMVTATTGAAMGATAMTTVQIGIAMGDKPVLLVSADPSNVPVQGTAQITVIARNSDGSPVAAGQEVILTTSLGTLNPSRPKTKADGTATSTLNVGSQAGTATVSAVLGASDAATTMVTIRDAASAIDLLANPQVISFGTNTSAAITITAFVANSQGIALSGASVTFAATAGSLDKNLAVTNTDGTAVVTLTVQSTQVKTGDVVTVTGKTPSGSGQFLTSTVNIPVQ